MFNAPSASPDEAPDATLWAPVPDAAEEDCSAAAAIAGTSAVAAVPAAVSAPAPEARVSLADVTAAPDESRSAARDSQEASYGMSPAEVACSELAVQHFPAAPTYAAQKIDPAGLHCCCRPEE